MNVKVSCPSRRFSSVLDLDSTLTLGQLRERISQEINLPHGDSIEILSGFPPRCLKGEDSSLISGPEVGLRKGTMLTIKIIEGISLDPEVSQLIDMGFHRKVAINAWSASGGNLEMALEFAAEGMKAYEEQEEEEKKKMDERIRNQKNQKEGINGTHSLSTINRLPSPIMMKRKIAADNSCLFNAVAYCVEKDRYAADRLRQVISKAVMSNPEKYNTAILGRPPVEYCAWIQDSSKWGGEIEMLILSDHYKIEIAAIEIKSQTCYYYGQGKGYKERIFLLYDGIHYDAIVFSDDPDGNDTTGVSDTSKFLAKDTEKYDQAMEVAKKAFQNHQFTDQSKFFLKCMDCDVGLKGQDEAMEHMRRTNHQNFGQIDR